MKMAEKHPQNIEGAVFAETVCQRAFYFEGWIVEPELLITDSTVASLDLVGCRVRNIDKRKMILFIFCDREA